MNIPKNIKDLEGVTVVKVTKEAWGPSGTLGLAKPGVAAGIASFQLTIPTSANDIWDYIWRSEKEKQSTEKVQLFQERQRIPGSRVTGIAREGADERWDASGPEQYRLTFEVPMETLKPNAPIQIRFFWDGKLISTAGPT